MAPGSPYDADVLTKTSHERREHDSETKERKRPRQRRASILFGSGLERTSHRALGRLEVPELVFDALTPARRTMPRHERPERQETQRLESGAPPRDVRVLQVRGVARGDEVSRHEDAGARRVNAEVPRRVSVAGMKNVQPEPSRLEEKGLGDDSRGDVRRRRFEQVRDFGVFPALGAESGMLF